MAENNNPSWNNTNPTTPTNPTKPIVQNQGGSGGRPPYPPNNNQGNNSGNILKIIAIVLGIALIACLGVLYYVWNQSKDTISVVTLEKEQVTNDLLQLRSEYAELRTNNDTLNAQLGIEKQKIDVLLEKIKRTDASNRAKIKEYEQELGSLRSLLRGYVQTIDSLDNVNKRLVAENKEIRQRATESERKVNELSQKTDNLQSMVEKGAVVKIRDVMISAINNKGKDVSRARQVDRLRTCFTIVGNTIAEKGVRTLYVRIKGADGSLLTTSPNNLFSMEDGSQMVYSAMREVDYQGEDLEVCIFYTDNEYMAGTYTAEVYMGGALLGKSQLLLK